MLLIAFLSPEITPLFVSVPIEPELNTPVAVAVVDPPVPAAPVINPPALLSSDSILAEVPVFLTPYFVPEITPVLVSVVSWRELTIPLVPPVIAPPALFSEVIVPVLLKPLILPEL